MKTHRISRTIVATMVAVSLAGSGSAWADRKSDQRGYGHAQSGYQNKHSQGRDRGGQHDKRNNKRYEKRSYGRGQDGHGARYYAYNKHRKNKNKRHYYKDSHKRNYYRGHGGRTYYYEDDDDNDDNLLIGLLMGGLIGYAINSAQQHDSYGYDSYPQSYGGAEAGIYEGDSSCLQEREYQMKVMVGGRSVDAYGTACLQPDGSWSRGPAKVASF